MLFSGRGAPCVEARGRLAGRLGISSVLAALGRARCPQRRETMGVLYSRVPPQDHATIKAAAKAAGLSIGEFVHRASLRAAEGVTGARADDLLGMVREVRDHLLGAGGTNAEGEAGAAIACLVRAGWTRADAAQKVATITASEDGLAAADIIRRAFKNGKE